MPNSPLPPVIGAAIRLHQLPQYAAWLAADQRDLEIQDPCYPHYLDDADWRAEARAGRALLDARGYAGRIGIHAAYDGLELFTRDRRIRQVIVERHMQALEFAALLQATHMVIHSPFLVFGNAFANYGPGPQRSAIIESAQEILSEVLPAAAAVNCTLVIECCMDKNPAPLIDLVRSFGTAAVQLSIDTGHAFVMQQEGGASPEQWVADAGALLGHVHLQDVDGLGDRHWPLGDGAINWTAFFRALAALEHSPRLVIEVDDVMRSFEYLRARGLGR